MIRRLLRVCRVAAWVAPLAWAVAVPVVIVVAMRHPGGHPSAGVLALDASVELARWLGAAGLALAAIGLFAAKSTSTEEARGLGLAAAVNALLAGAAWVMPML